MRTITYYHHLLILSQIYAAASSAIRNQQPIVSSQRAIIVDGADSIQRRQKHCTVDNMVAIPRGGSDNDESDTELDDETIPIASISRPTSSSSNLLSKIYLSIILRMKRGFIAGWDAARDKRNDDANSDNDNNLPKLHSFLGKTSHVFHETYRGVVLSGEGPDEAAAAVTQCDVELEQSTMERSRQLKTRKRHHRHGHKRRRKKHSSKRRVTTTSPTSIANGGGQQSKDDDTTTTTNTIQSLVDKYNVEETNTNHHTSVFTATQTSFHDALQKSNADARFLICYISQSSANTDNKRVIPALLHSQFTKLIQRKPLGKKNLQNTGSYYLWICEDNDQSSSTSIAEVVKRLKLKSTIHSKDNKSILAIIHPASAIDTNTGKLKVLPKLLAQHHCNPPPSTVDAMSSWVTTVRKRHLRDFAKLQFDRKERILHQERSMGYKQSIVEDINREQREAMELAKKQKQEEAEIKRMEEIQRRRLVLLENLPEEPQDGEVITIALRFGDNVSSCDLEASTQRKFRMEESVNTVFNWMDAVHGLERERMTLSTMNGSKSFVYVNEDKEVVDDDEEGERSLSLEEAGLGKMTALRVSEIATTEEATEVDEE
eukprot:scaffold26996_cov49-Cyclotella_meneghiniana.AAC.3